MKAACRPLERKLEQRAACVEPPSSRSAASSAVGRQSDTAPPAVGRGHDRGARLTVERPRGIALGPALPAASPWAKARWRLRPLTPPPDTPRESSEPTVPGPLRPATVPSRSLSLSARQAARPGRALRPRRYQRGDQDEAGRCNGGNKANGSGKRGSRADCDNAGTSHHVKRVPSQECGGSLVFLHGADDCAASTAAWHAGESDGDTKGEQLCQQRSS